MLLAHASRGQWRLAPAFDLNPFPDRVRELKTWISEDTGREAKGNKVTGTHAWKLMVYWVRRIICSMRHVICPGIVSGGTFICRTGRPS